MAACSAAPATELAPTAAIGKARGVGRSGPESGRDIAGVGRGVVHLGGRRRTPAAGGPPSAACGRRGGLALLLLADQLTELALDPTEEVLEVGLGLRRRLACLLRGLGVGFGGGLGFADTLHLHVEVLLGDLEPVEQRPTVAAGGAQVAEAAGGGVGVAAEEAVHRRQVAAVDVGLHGVVGRAAVRRAPNSALAASNSAVARCSSAWSASARAAGAVVLLRVQLDLLAQGDDLVLDLRRLGLQVADALGVGRGEGASAASDHADRHDRASASRSQRGLGLPGPGSPGSACPLPEAVAALPEEEAGPVAPTIIVSKR